MSRRTRAAAVAKEVLGTEPLAGVLVVDRYHAYSRAPCRLQYCYAHLSRDVEDVQKEFATDAEVQAFTASLIPLLAQALHLRAQPITDEEYYREARRLKAGDRGRGGGRGAARGHSQTPRPLP